MRIDQSFKNCKAHKYSKYTQILQKSNTDIHQPMNSNSWSNIILKHGNDLFYSTTQSLKHLDFYKDILSSWNGFHKNRTSQIKWKWWLSCQRVNQLMLWPYIAKKSLTRSLTKISQSTVNRNKNKILCFGATTDSSRKKEFMSSYHSRKRCTMMCLHGSILELALANIFINNLEKGVNRLADLKVAQL